MVELRLILRILKNWLKIGGKERRRATVDAVGLGGGEMGGDEP
jgi:hypothetical protein